MAGLLDGKVAVVTGGGRGIGRGEALALAAAGAKVIVNDLGCDGWGRDASHEPADSVVAEIKQKGGTAIANYSDVSTLEGGEGVVKAAVDNFGTIHILVNNAGILRDRMVFNMTDEEWDGIMKFHLYGTFYSTRAASRIMRQQEWGRIINTSSTSGLGNWGQTNYGAAKEGIAGFTRCVARDLGRFNITCNALRPSAGTRMTLSPEVRAAAQRAGRARAIEDTEAQLPEYVGPLVVYLASEHSAKINGCVLRVVRGQIGIYPEPQEIRTIFKDGMWTPEELVNIMPRTIETGLVNPQPPQPAQPKQ